MPKFLQKFLCKKKAKNGKRLGCPARVCPRESLLRWGIVAGHITYSKQDGAGPIQPHRWLWNVPAINTCDVTEVRGLEVRAQVLVPRTQPSASRSGIPKLLSTSFLLQIQLSSSDIKIAKWDFYEHLSCEVLKQNRMRGWRKHGKRKEPSSWNLAESRHCKTTDESKLPTKIEHVFLKIS